MKKQETITRPMDDIVFENRNRMYGAYILRKMYNKEVVRALIISIAIMVAGLAYPLASSYRANNTGRSIGIIDETIFMPKAPDKAEIPDTPPPPPPSTDTEKKIMFIAPTVTNDDVPDDIISLNQDDLNMISTNEPVNATEEPVVVKKDDIIEVIDISDPVIFAEEMPSFPGGDGERLRFLSDNIQYPQLASENGIQGTVYVQFIVNSTGEITDAKILRGIGGGCDEEALRVVNAMPRWHPGKQNGKNVRVLFSLSVSFRLQG